MSEPRAASLAAPWPRASSLHCPATPHAATGPAAHTPSPIPHITAAPFPSSASLAAAAAVSSAASAGLRLRHMAPAASATAAPSQGSSSSVSESSSHDDNSAGVPSPPSPTASTATSSSPAQPPLEGRPVPWASLGPLELLRQRLVLGGDGSGGAGGTSGTSESGGNSDGSGSNGATSADGGGGTAFALIAPADVDAVMDLYLELGQLDADPYWCRAWPSAIALAALLLRRPELVRGRVVGELGAGLGLAGIAAAMAGAREVVLLDREPAALQCALLGAAASGLGAAVERGGPPPVGTAPGAPRLALKGGCDGAAGIEGRPVSGGGADAAWAADWAELLARARALSGAGASNSGGEGSSSGGSTILRAAVLDWNAPPPLAQLLPPAPPQPASSSPSSAPSPRKPPPRSFDVLLACDVLYEEGAVGPLAALVPHLLGGGGGGRGGGAKRLLLADPPARTARHREAFLRALQSGPGGLRLAVEEASLTHCAAAALDPEMAGGVAPGTPSLPVQFVALRAADERDTVGVKL